MALSYGDLVTVRYPDGALYTGKIGRPGESGGAVIRPNTPLGNALLGKRFGVGARVEYSVPGQGTFVVTLEELEKADEGCA
ncbi:hypothetical protein KC614_04385 [candidate division WWE3 bacterium]|uniref:Transcription elongation factor GreA/GreB C-terminal domain-containing protein n=1 Tax=candidate division WWE3 bacterium TaxID=2053526 RepID=A0A955LKY0_UNCKA|nr:hypothetical protein [candidate division WWE3 bacterium]